VLSTQIRSRAAADTPLAAILERAAAYVDTFEQQLTGIVAEETYVQDAGSLHRELKSDLLLVRVNGSAQYVEFRDVFEVDGRAVRDRDDRLTRLFVDPSPSAAAQLQAIVAESARYNIGSIQRTINTPTLALAFLRAENQHGSTFKIARGGLPELARRGPEAAVFAVPAGSVVVSFDEAPRNTVIRTGGGRDLPSHGRFWIDPETGTVLATELVAENPQIGGVIDVRYRLDQPAGAMVPIEMREQYRKTAGVGVSGVAKYAQFRKFEVRTSTELK
jgi:hypothetical protein